MPVSSPPSPPPLPSCILCCRPEGPALTQTPVGARSAGGPAWASGSCWVLRGRHTPSSGLRHCSEIELACLSGPGPPFLAWKLRPREAVPLGYGRSQQSWVPAFTSGCVSFWTEPRIPSLRVVAGGLGWAVLDWYPRREEASAL